MTRFAAIRQRLIFYIKSLNSMIKEDPLGLELELRHPRELNRPPRIYGIELREYEALKGVLRYFPEGATLTTIIKECQLDSSCREVGLTSPSKIRRLLLFLVERGEVARIGEGRGALYIWKGSSESRWRSALLTYVDAIRECRGLYVKPELRSKHLERLEKIFLDWSHPERVLRIQLIRHQLEFLNDLEQFVKDLRPYPMLERFPLHRHREYSGLDFKDWKLLDAKRIKKVSDEEIKRWKDIVAEYVKLKYYPSLRESRWSKFRQKRLNRCVERLSRSPSFYPLLKLMEVPEDKRREILDKLLLAIYEEKAMLYQSLTLPAWKKKYKVMQSIMVIPRSRLKKKKKRGLKGA